MKTVEKYYQGAGHYKLLNAYEGIVMENVHNLMSKQDMCHCEKCFYDVCAIVYNKGFVRFVTSDQGALLAKVPTLNNGSHVELLVAVSEAIEMVRSSPKHDA